jgi:hypothetical protein
MGGVGACACTNVEVRKKVIIKRPASVQDKNLLFIIHLKLEVEITIFFAI